MDYREYENSEFFRETVQFLADNRPNIKLTELKEDVALSLSLLRIHWNIENDQAAPTQEQHLRDIKRLGKAAARLHKVLGSIGEATADIVYGAFTRDRKERRDPNEEMREVDTFYEVTAALAEYGSEKFDQFKRGSGRPRSTKGHTVNQALYLTNRYRPDITPSAYYGNRFYKLCQSLWQLATDDHDNIDFQDPIRDFFKANDLRFTKGSGCKPS